MSVDTTTGVDATVDPSARRPVPTGLPWLWRDSFAEARRRIAEGACTQFCPRVWRPRCSPR